MDGIARSRKKIRCGALPAAIAVLAACVTANAFAFSEGDKGTTAVASHRVAALSQQGPTADANIGGYVELGDTNAGFGKIIRTCAVKAARATSHWRCMDSLDARAGSEECAEQVPALRPRGAAVGWAVIRPDDRSHARAPSRVCCLSVPR